MSDLIRRQDAIDAVKFGITYAKAIDVNTGESKELFKEGNDALKKAVKRLKELPSAEPKTPSNGSITCVKSEKMHDRTMGDLISRQDAKDAIDMALDHIDHVPPWVYDNLLNALNEVPSAEKAQLFGEDATKDATSDLISRKKALDVIRTLQTYKLFEGDDMILVDKADVQTELMMLPSAEPEINKQKLIRTMNAGIIATNTEDVYSCGMRNGIRWCRALLEDDPPKYEDASQYAESKPKTGKWIPYSKVYECRYECSSCGYHLIGIHESEANFCPNCGADMREGEQE